MVGSVAVAMATDQGSSSDDLNQHLDQHLDDTAMGRLAKTHFRLPAPPQFSRKDIHHPLLKATPDEEKHAALRIWKVILRFTGDVTDNGQSATITQQPHTGSVMSRLTKELGLDSRLEQAKPHPDMVSPGTSRKGTFSSRNGELDLHTLPNKPKGGTLRQLKATLTLRLFKNRDRSVLHSLPLEETLASPLEEVQYIIGYGILKPCLRDEIYCQTCKQLVKNPHKTGLARGWMLLGLVIASFPPSDQIVDAITEFVAAGPSLYCTSLKRILARSLRNGPRYQPPASIEFEMALQRKSLEIQVTMMDGTVQTVIIDGATSSRDMCTKLSELVGVRQKFGFSLYIAMVDKVASLGSGSDHVMDAISQCEHIFYDQHGTRGNAPWRLFFRKELFSPWDAITGDMIAISLVYAQITRGVLLGEYVCESDQELATLAARQYYIEYGEEVNDEGLQVCLPAFIPADRRPDDEAHKGWRKSIMKSYQRMFGKDCFPKPNAERVKLDVVNYASVKWAMAFSRYYDVIKLEGPMDLGDSPTRLAVNSTGIYLMSANRRMLQEISFPEIMTIKGESSEKDVPNSSQVILFVLADGSCLKLETIDADDIRETVDFILSGLRKRSRWAVAREDHIAMRGGELSCAEGDLLELDKPASGGALVCDVTEACNTSTGHTGEILSALLFILPVLSRPPEEVLNIFRSRKPAMSFTGVIEEESFPSNGHDASPSNHASNGYATEMTPEFTNPQMDKRENGVNGFTENDQEITISMETSPPERPTYREQEKKLDYKGSTGFSSRMYLRPSRDHSGPGTPGVLDEIQDGNYNDFSVRSEANGRESLVLDLTNGNEANGEVVEASYL